MKNKEMGITLIALAVTIIVLLILAGIVINLTVGNNGLFERARDTTGEYDKASVMEEVNMILSEYQFAKLSGETTSLEDFLEEKGFENITNNGDGTIKAEYKGYEVIIDGDKLEIKEITKLGGVVPEFTVTQETSADNKKVTIKVTITNEVGSVDSIKLINEKGQEVTGTINGKEGTFEVTANGTYTVEVKATTEEVQRSNRKKVEVNSILVEFSTNYGRIEVVWLNTNNEIIEKPNSPASHLGGMTPVKWNGTTEVPTTTEDASWYNYTKIEGDGDNRTSHWANAKNTIDGIDSYFVWIPRYGYRITYYASEDSKIETGYCDGRGIVDTIGTVKYTLDEGIETVEKDGKSYIVHPAFMNNSSNEFKNGGWDSDLAGIWVGKYESSHSDATESLEGSNVKMKIVAGVSSWRNIDIGDCYTKAFEYDRSKESHLMKNSEWGAVAYLTHSQYGRNGYEIDINNSSSYITGNGGGSTDASEAIGVTNAYDSDVGQKASSTGNIYGIYDLSGGAEEYVASFNDTDTNNNESSNGSSFASPNNQSTKYATKYNNQTQAAYGTKIYEVGRIGDGTKETYAGSKRNWFNDASYFLNARLTFGERGGTKAGASGSGIFHFNDNEGKTGKTNSFRVVLNITNMDSQGLS